MTRIKHNDIGYVFGETKGHLNLRAKMHKKSLLMALAVTQHVK